MNNWIHSFNALTARERGLILLTLLVLLILPTALYVLEPNSNEQRTLEQQINQLQRSNQKTAADIQVTISPPQVDPNAALQTQIDLRRQQLFDINRSLNQSVSGLVSPQDMLGMLQQILADYPGIKLISVNKAPATAFDVNSSNDSRNASLTESPTNSSPKPQEQEQEQHYGIYQHGFTLVIEGGLTSVVAYLQHLEQLPQQLFWDAMDYQALDRAKAKITISIYTLSAERAWLGV